MLRHSDGLQLIWVSENQIVLKRGIQELLLGGTDAVKIVEPLLILLNGTRNAEQIIEVFPASLHSHVRQLLTILSSRRLIIDDDMPAGVGDEPLQAAFYANFSSLTQGIVEQLRTEKVIIYGANLISRTLVQQLLEMGIGRVTLVDHMILTNRLMPVGWIESLLASEEERFIFLTEVPPAADLADSSLLCATSDYGEADALFDLNRAAIGAGTRFLPVWLSEMLGYAGPLHYPFETACLRCYQLRVASNNPRREVTEAIRVQITGDLESRPGTGMLPPMAGIMGEIAAMEIVKTLGGFAPSDALSRVIEINLLSFRSSVRRVLKIPRCPDCSDIMQRGQKVVMHGPQIPQRR